MRWYQLFVNGALLAEAPKLPLMRALATCPPPNIAFDIKTYNEAFATTIGYIRIHNISASQYVKFSQLKGAPVLLLAGMTNETFAKHHSTQIGNCVLVFGTISNVAAELGEREIWVDIYFGPPVNEEVDNVSVQGKGFQATVEPNMPVIPPLTTVIAQCSGWILKTASESLNLVVNSSPQQLVIAGNSLLELTNCVRQTFKDWGFRQVTSIPNTIEVYDQSQVELTKGVKYIKPGDILKQPSVVNLINLELTVALDPSYQVGQTVILAGLLPTNIASVSSTGFIPSAINLIETLYSVGMYKIIGVNHIGEFYNTSAEGWSTQLLLTRIEKLGELTPDDIIKWQASGGFL